MSKVISGIPDEPAVLRRDEKGKWRLGKTYLPIERDTLRLERVSPGWRVHLTLIITDLDVAPEYADDPT